MAISRSKKEALVAELVQDLADAQMVVYAEYSGISVADLQQLRRQARENGVTIKVVAMDQHDSLKQTDTSAMKGQVLYAISNDDEVLPAKVLAQFADKTPELKLVGAFNSLGQSLSTAEVTDLAKLPTKNELIAQTVAQLLSPVNDTVNALSGNLSALLDGIADHASA